MDEEIEQKAVALLGKHIMGPWGALPERIKDEYRDLARRGVTPETMAMVDRQVDRVMIAQLLWVATHSGQPPTTPTQVDRARAHLESFEYHLKGMGLGIVPLNYRSKVIEDLALRSDADLDEQYDYLEGENERDAISALEERSSWIRMQQE